MKRNHFSPAKALGVLLLIIISGAGLASSPPVSQAAGPTPRKAPAAKFAPGEVLVKLRAGVAVRPADLQTSSPTLNRLLQAFHLSELRPVFPDVQAPPRGPFRLPNGQQRQLPDLSRIYRLHFSQKADIFAVITALEQNPAVEYAEPNYERHIVDTTTTAVTPNDPYYSSSGSWGQGYADMWGLQAIQAGQAWAVTTGSTAIIIAVADTGVDLTHPDLAGKLVAGYDFANGDTDPQDDNGHGTHVAGTIAAATNNGIGIAGICWQCKIMPLKGLDAQGSGYDSDLADAVRYAADHGARVVNASWGGPGYSQTLDQAFTYADGKGVVLAVAAGNDGSTDVGSPASFPVSIAVSATDHNDQIASFSNYGSAIAVAAPGVDILSLRAAGTDMYGDGLHTVGSNYYRSNGTSMAAPHVAGLAGLILSLHPDWTPDQVRSTLTGSADDLGSPGRDDYYGYGRINAYRALQGATPPPGTTATATPTATASPPSSCLAESAHPYANNFDYTWTLTNPDPGAVGTRVQFSRLETEQNYDYVILRDGSGVEFQRFDGTVSNHTWSDPIPGQVVKIELVSDYSITAWGFCVEALINSDITATPTPTETPTGPGACRTYRSSDTPLPIPDADWFGVSSDIPIPDSFSVVDANLTLTVTHTWDEDLLAYLYSPWGTEVTLFENVGGAGDNFTNTTFDDEAAQTIASGTPPFTGSFRPVSPLYAIDGEQALGTWSLVLYDDVYLDTGTLQAWQLELCSTGPPATDTPTPTPSTSPSPTPTGSPTATPTASDTPTPTPSNTPTSTGSPTPTPCPADLNGDSRVDESDAAAAANAWHTHAGDAAYDARVDRNGDGEITVYEVQWVAAQVGCGS